MFTEHLKLRGKFKIAIRFYISGFPFHQHFAVIDCVLPFACRDYSTNVTCRAFTWKVRALYNDIRYIQVRMKSNRWQYDRKMKNFHRIFTIIICWKALV